MLTEIAEAIATASISRGVAIAGNLRDTGSALAAALFTWFLVWRALRVATDGRDSLAEFFGDLIEKLTVATVVYWLLQAATYATFVQEWAWNGLRDIAVRAAGMTSSVPGTGPLQALELSLDQFRDGVIGALVKVEDSLGSGFDPVSWLTGILRNQLVTLVVAGIVIVILAIAKALAVGAFCLGAVMFGVGAALGPLFLPLVLHERLDNYFWAWLRFLLVSGATLLVGVIIVLLLAEALRPLAGPGGSLSGEFGALVGASGVNNLDFLTAATKAIVVALFLAYVLAQIPEITNALFSGSTAGIRSGAGAAMRHIVRGGAAAFRATERRLGPNRPQPRAGPGSGPGRGGGLPRAPVGGPAVPQAAAPRSPGLQAAAMPAAGVDPEAASSQAAWLPRTPEGVAVAGSRAEVDRAAAAGDPAAQQIVRLRRPARAQERPEQGVRPRRTLKRVALGDDESGK
jgi:TrbL/VirB6 plasmid conjugal transfer protein